jgi:N-acetyltransferase
MSSVTLEGKSVRLEPMRPEHAVALAEVGLGRDIFRYFPIAIDTPEQMAAHVRHCVAGTDEGTPLTWTTVSLADGRPVGSTGYLNIDRQNRRLEIGGTWISPE